MSIQMVHWVGNQGLPGVTELRSPVVLGYHAMRASKRKLTSSSATGRLMGDRSHPKSYLVTELDIHPPSWLPWDIMVK